MKDLSKVVALMGVKEHPDEEVGKLKFGGHSDDALFLKQTPKREVDFVSEEDFEEPKRENFENLLKRYKDGSTTDDGTVVHYLYLGSD